MGKVVSGYPFPDLVIFGQESRTCTSIETSWIALTEWLMVESDKRLRWVGTPIPHPHGFESHSLFIRGVVRGIPPMPVAYG